MVTGIRLNDRLFLKRISTAALIAFAATLPTKWVNLNSFFVVLLTLVWFADLIIIKGKISYNMVALFSFISFFLLTLFSIFYSSNLSTLFSKLETRLVILVFPLILLGSGHFQIDTRTVKLILKAFLISCLLISLLCIVHTFYVNYVNGNTYHFYNNWLFSSDNLVDRFGFHPSYFSIYCAFSVFILLFLLNEKEWSLAICAFLILYLCIVQLLLASRVGMLSFVVLFVLTIVYEAYKRKRILLGLSLASAFLGIMLILGINSQTVKDKFDALLEQNIHQYNEHFRVNRRAIQWNSALEVFLKSPILGVGTGDMQDELQKIYLEKDFMEGYENAYNPHNLFLDSAASLGVLGLISNLILFGLSSYSAVHHGNILYVQFLILFLLISLVESTFSVQKGVAFFFFFNTLFYCYFSKPPGNSSI